MRVGNGPDSRTLHEKLRMLTSLWTECPRRDLTPHTPVILRSYSRIHRAQLISPVDPLSLHICGLGALKQTPFSTTAESAHVSRVTCSLCLEMQRHCRSFYPSVIKAAGSNGKYLQTGIWMLQVGECLKAPTVHVLNWSVAECWGSKVETWQCPKDSRSAGSEWQGALQLLRGMQDKSIPASVISSLGSPWCSDTGGIDRLTVQKR